MPRYRVNARFGSWKIGEIFESETDYHASLAEDGRFLTQLNVPVEVEDDETTDDLPSEQSAPVVPVSDVWPA